MDNGNTIGLVSSYETTGGKTAEMADVWFQTQPANLRNNVANLANTLTAYQAGEVHHHSAGYATGGFDLADKMSVVDKHDAVGTVVADMVDNLKHFNANGVPMTNTTLMTAAQPMNVADCLLSDKKDKGGILGGGNK
jgi:hypothetical protein